MTAHRHTINIHANQDGMDPLPVAVDTYDTFVSVRLGDVSFFIPDLAAAADLSERISIAVTAAMLDAAAGDPLPFDLHDVSRRLRTMRYREQIAELTAEEYEADDRDERLADAIAAEDGAA